MLLCLKAARKNGIDLDQWDHSEACPLLARSPACPHSLFALERQRASAILPRSDWGRPSACGTDGADEGEARITSLPVRHPHDAVREHGTYGGQGKAVRRQGAPTALLFVCAF